MIDINEYTDEKGRFDGRYLLIRPLSTDGATADVWLSLDLNTVSMTDGDKIDEIARMSDDEIEKLGLMVAIKIYRPQNALDVEGEQRFRDEYMIVFNCHHANLIHPTNFSIFKDTPYLVLPYCKQGSSELLIGNEFSDDEIWKYIQDVASGLAYLHALEPPIVHQDVKPANILLDDTGHYALTDFGISAQRGGVHGYYYDDENSGTMAYMAPERFQKDAEPMAQSDIWGFGATLCEILTGKVPFGEDGGQAQAEGKYPMPSIPGVSADIQRLIHDCLAQQPGDRPSAQQVADAARARQYPPKSRRPLWLSLIALAIVAAAGLIYYAFSQQHEPVVQPEVSPEQQFNYAYRLIDNYERDSVLKGKAILDSLSLLKYVPAQLELARTIGPEYIEASTAKYDKRKRMLQIDTIHDRMNQVWPKEQKLVDQAISLYQQILNQSDSVFPATNFKAAFALTQIYGSVHYNPDGKYNHLIIPHYDKAIEWAKCSGDTAMATKLSGYKQRAQKDIENFKK